MLRSDSSHASGAPKLFPHGVFHAENVGGQIDEVLNQRVWLGCFPFRFRGGEAAFARIVAFVEER